MRNKDVCQRPQACPRSQWINSRGRIRTQAFWLLIWFSYHRTRMKPFWLPNITFAVLTESCVSSLIVELLYFNGAFQQSLYCVGSKLSRIETVFLHSLFTINCWLTKLIFILLTFPFPSGSLLFCLHASAQWHFPLDLNLPTCQGYVCRSLCRTSWPSTMTDPRKCSINTSSRNKGANDWIEALEAQRRTINRLEITDGTPYKLTE